MFSFTHMTLLLFKTLLLISLFSSEKQQKVPVEITVTDIRNQSGTIRIGIFYEDKSFQDEVTKDYIFIDKEELKDGRITKTVLLPVGKLGLSVLDDENDNKKMDYNWIGMPTEGFGFSNYYHSGFSKPHYESFEIEIKPNAENQVIMKLRYIL